MTYPFASPNDLVAIWRPLSDDEITVATARLDQASRKIRREIPPIDGKTIDERITASLLSLDDVKDVAVEMVKRVMSLPGYIRQQSVTVDDATKSQTFDSSVSSGVMFIAPEERASLMGRPNMGAFTISPAGSPDATGGYSTAEQAREQWLYADLLPWT